MVGINGKKLELDHERYLDLSCTSQFVLYTSHLPKRYNLFCDIFTYFEDIFYNLVKILSSFNKDSNYGIKLVMTIIKI